MVIIGFSGGAKHGKDTAAEALIAHLDSIGATYNVSSFSHEIHKDCAQIIANKIGCTIDEAYIMCTDQNVKDTPFNDDGDSPRTIMQDHGNEMRRVNGENYWINRYLEKIPDVDVLVNTSFRFDNEIAYFRAGPPVLRGGEFRLINVFNPNVTIARSGDVTETGVVNEVPDAFIVNDYDPKTGVVDGVPIDMQVIESIEGVSFLKEKDPEPF